MTEHIEKEPARAGEENGGKPDDVGQNKPFEVEVIYNGMAKEITVSKAELISSVLQKAIAAFGNLPAPHTLALYDAEGRELPDNETVHDAKLKKGERLQLRPSTVKAG
jgi:hypothetical protein